MQTVALWQRQASGTDGFNSPNLKDQKDLKDRARHQRNTHSRCACNCYPRGASQHFAAEAHPV